MRFAAKSDIGLVRKLNQDAYLVHPTDRDSCIVVVADGMGGSAAGEVASALALRAMEEELTNGGASDSAEARLSRAIRSANSEIYHQAALVPAYSGMGTTIVAAELDARQAVVAHVGDSRAYHLSAQGVLTQLTDDHSLVNELIRRGQLSPSEAAGHPQRHVLTRSLGTLPNVAVDVKSWSWMPGDLILVCSDGLTSYVDDAAIRDSLLGDRPPADKVSALVAAALRAGGYDNITVAVLAHDGEAKWRDCD